ncbi:heavy metal-associated isoprenylated plant protein 28 [Ipomoea triloba]|uniref:heavy metal-associated isoprenylated plant protein 28 n=1 Tax=Ipomoea triloba TaxID=35885 RepID=UPI00125E4498|nr:heavy metal-associated isoprenylated plant protein 28 [Ipomoea triloba]
MTVIEMRVHMDCGGCESKIRKALQKLKGVDEVDIDMTMQKVTVTGWADQKKVLKTVRKTGRRAEIWQFPFNNPEMVNHNNHVAGYYPQQSYGGPATFHCTSQPPSSSYNYYKHGYDNFDRSFRLGRGNSGNIFGSRIGGTFSDENPHSCSIM